MKKKISIFDEFGFQWRKEHIVRKEYKTVTVTKIKRLRRQNETLKSMVVENSD